jgi:hypothetical protein
MISLTRNNAAGRNISQIGRRFFCSPGGPQVPIPGEPVDRAICIHLPYGRYLAFLKSPNFAAAIRNPHSLFAVVIKAFGFALVAYVARFRFFLRGFIV